MPQTYFHVCFSHIRLQALTALYYSINYISETIKIFKIIFLNIKYLFFLGAAVEHQPQVGEMKYGEEAEADIHSDNVGMELKPSETTLPYM